MEKSIEEIEDINNINEYIINKYFINNKIGAGDLSIVYNITEKTTNEKYILKILSKEEINKRDKINRVMMEKEILEKIHHPLIISNHEFYECEKNYYFINEYCPHTLHKLLLKNTIFIEEWIKFYAAELLCAIEFLHHKGYVHRDIKPENILIAETGHIKLADFDLSTKSNVCNYDIIKKYYFGNIKYVNHEPHINSNSFVGTPEYLAPEILNNKLYTASVDWWEFGILLYEMKYGYTPFKGTGMEDTFDNIMNLQVLYDNKVEISRELKKLLEALLNKNNNSRLGFKYGSYEIKNHIFFKDVKFQLIMNIKPPYVP